MHELGLKAGSTNCIRSPGSASKGNLLWSGKGIVRRIMNKQYVARSSNCTFGPDRRFYCDQRPCPWKYNELFLCIAERGINRHVCFPVYPPLVLAVQTISPYIPVVLAGVAPKSRTLVPGRKGCNQDGVFESQNEDIARKGHGTLACWCYR